MEAQEAEEGSSVGNGVSVTVLCAISVVLLSVHSALEISRRALGVALCLDVALVWSARNKRE